MSIQINTSAQRVNRYSDFSLEFSLTKDGVAYTPASFIMVFYVDEWDDCSSRYVASQIDRNPINCYVRGGNIVVYFDSPNFNIGQLKCRFVDMVSNSNFSDGTLDTCTPIFLPVEIVAGAGDTNSVVLGYGSAYFGENHDLVLEGPASPSFGTDNDLTI